MGTGRDSFRRFSKLLNALSFGLRICPSEIKYFLWKITNLFPRTIGAGFRYAIARSSLKSCGDNVFFGEYIEIRHWNNLALGSNVSIHRGCYIDALGGVVIGNDVSIAHGCSFVSFEHQWDDCSLPIKYNPVKLSVIKVENDVWIGCGSRILAGVTVFSRTIVAAGAVVCKNAGPQAIVGGVPAKVIKSI